MNHSEDCFYVEHIYTQTFSVYFTEKSLSLSRKKMAKTQRNTSFLIDYQPFLLLLVKFTITIASSLPRNSFKRKQALTMLLLASEFSNVSQRDRKTAFPIYSTPHPTPSPSNKFIVCFLGERRRRREIKQKFLQDVEKIGGERA